MTRREYYKKCLPVFNEYLDEMRKNGAQAVDNAFDIACVKEILWRLDIDADDQVDDIPLFDEMTPEFFLEDFLNMCADWDNMGELFVNDYGQGYDTFCEIIETAKKDWEARGEEDEEQ